VSGAAAVRLSQLLCTPSARLLTYRALPSAPCQPTSDYLFKVRPGLSPHRSPMLIVIDASDSTHLSRFHAVAADRGLWRGQVVPSAPICGESRSLGCASLAQKRALTTLSFARPQDDTYTESYISTIGVDFVSSGAGGSHRRARGLMRYGASGRQHMHAVAPCRSYHCHLHSQKIRTVELDGKVIKLQIVSHWAIACRAATVSRRLAGCELHQKQRHPSKAETARSLG
jgi:hypothetical protein